ncbi:HAD family hydrolase [Frankia sp. Cppng1_Ct_nod]|uniref:HAD family hydrolase n=1 Tax=Frankia sp. Cppng1_Ct_nod TaxID=2897162 RepID=UPI001F5FE675|nr:HAD family hydrolase [Frankia sp. Cppng1_Ct_nod]
MTVVPVAVVFDWGGTLTPFHDVDLLDLWRVVARDLAPGHAAELTWLLEDTERQWWATEGGAGRSGTVMELLAAVSAAVGLDVSGAVHRVSARHDLRAWTPHTVCDPEALLLMHLVRARGLRIGLLTNTHWPRSWHSRWLARDGLLELFDARVYTNDLPFSKPHPGAFHAALASLGVSDPRSAVFVGDRPASDIAGARAVGMRTVLLSDGLRPQLEASGPAGGSQADAVIGRLGCLPGVLDRWAVSR